MLGIGVGYRQSQKNAKCAAPRGVASDMFAIIHTDGHNIRLYTHVQWALGINILIIQLNFINVSVSIILKMSSRK